MATAKNKIAQKLLSPFQTFVNSEAFSGMLLIFAALVAFCIANSPVAETYFTTKKMYGGLVIGDWQLKLALYHWINDGLMVIFFLLVGLEIKRELLVGELSKPRDAALSVVAALGGIIIPALIYTYFNYGGPGISGWGIPMATDIAFALGVMALLGSRVPLALKVFLTALAIVDDLVAVLVIALFYTENLNIQALLYSLGILAALGGYCLFGGRKLMIYMVIGVIAWYFMLKSGVHATIAGVLLAFTIPISRKLDPSVAETKMENIVKGEHEEVEVKLGKLEHELEHAQSPLHKLEHTLHPWVAFMILPLFAFANAGVTVSPESATLSPVVLGAALGLILGKPIGVFLFSFVACKIGIASLPKDVNWTQIFAVGMLAGIGFTMSFFIATLAFTDAALLDQSKIGILSASVLAALAGLTALAMATKKPAGQNE